ncbi:MAG: Phosphoribosylaminoimidazole-succinocarboxamide synthase [Candidatus Nitrospira kreftii]|uniref:Phosphoribosylaminoimidazole-succinocarboxamide synthase n=1 Tax=Candidatus Nitrospira kreftii TaxID=2652173 RepID=A0A7S8FBT8_9BACT|nr:MAG: Phosphoribosylaminoimidazole-succinocarboxamide synthase [Candidatus Nitrospira kreftii]
MAIGTLLYEGKAKKIFSTENADHVVQYFKDDATAFNAQKRGTIVEKGVINNKVSERIFRLLEQHGIPTHFVERLSEREMLTKKVRIVPVEVVMRNVIAGSLAKRLGLKEGNRIDPAIVEFYFKNDALGDPLVNDDHLRLMNVATPGVLRELREMGHAVNKVLEPFFAERRMQLVDFKLEFGVFHSKLILADEISPDTCRFWDMSTGESMDKDRFRKDMGKIEEAYQEVLARVCG